MERTASIFDIWVDNTTRLVNDWKNLTDKMNAEQKNVWEDAGKMQQAWMESFGTMMNHMQAPGLGGNGSNPFSHQTMREAFTNMLRSTDIYTRLLQLWQPVLQAMQQNSFNPQDFWKMVDQNAFKSVIDRLFGFDSGAALRSYTGQWMRISSMWFNSATEASKNFGSMFGNAAPFMGGMAQMDPQTMGNWYAEMARSAARSFAPFLGGNGDGTAPSPQPLTDLMERWGNYFTKLNQLQTLLYKTGVSAWEKVMQAVADRAAKGEAITDFNQFYNEWSSVNEKEFIALFNTDEYAALQAELIKLNSEVNKQYEKQMEALLQPYPVVFRSQLEEVYKTNHELRGRINDLEKLVTELTGTIKQNAATNTAANATAAGNTGESGKTPKG
jgi:hypothetical protein